MVQSPLETIISNLVLGSLVLYSWGIPEAGKLKSVKMHPISAAAAHSTSVVSLWQKAWGHQLGKMKCLFCWWPQKFSPMVGWLWCFGACGKAEHHGRELLVSQWLSINHMNKRQRRDWCTYASSRVCPKWLNSFWWCHLLTFPPPLNSNTGWKPSLQHMDLWEQSWHKLPTAGVDTNLHS